MPPQNCHDHDESSSAGLSGSSAEYTSTGQTDGLDDPMPFFFPPDGVSGSPASCSSAVSACASCVSGVDSWCETAPGVGGNPWDATCEGVCERSSCADACGASSAKQEAAAKIPTFDGSKMTPRDYHSIHALGNAPDGKPNSYLYAPDELDARLQASASICSFVETAHHGQQWKQRRRKLAPLAPLRAAHLPPAAPAERRRLQSSSGPVTVSVVEATCAAVGATAACNSTCPYANDYECDDGGPGALFSSCELGTDGEDCLYCGDPFCECLPGTFWNGAYTRCTSIHWQNTNTNPDVVAAGDYFNALMGNLTAASKYVKAVDKANVSPRPRGAPLPTAICQWMRCRLRYHRPALAACAQTGHADGPRAPRRRASGRLREAHCSRVRASVQ